MSRITYKVSLMLLIVVSYFILSGREGGCSEDKQKTWDSPVQAVCTLYESASGDVRAELVLISTVYSTSRFIDTATEVEFEVPGNTRLPMSQTTAGHYVITSADEPRLVYEPGSSYLFKFQLTDEDFTGPDFAGGYFVGEVSAPTQRPTQLAVYQETRGPDRVADMTWEPSFTRAIYWVMNEQGQITKSNWDFSQPDFDGSKWESLLREYPQDHEISGLAFQASGDYTIGFAGCNANGGFDVALSPELGLGSGFLACSEITATMEVP